MVETRFNEDVATRKPIRSKVREEKSEPGDFRHVLPLTQLPRPQDRDVRRRGVCFAIGISR